MVHNRWSDGDVLVLREPARVARTHPPLREDTDGHRRVDGGVDTDGEVARVLQDDGRAEVLEASLRPDVPLQTTSILSGPS